MLYLLSLGKCSRITIQGFLEAWVFLRSLVSSKYVTSVIDPTLLLDVRSYC